MIDLENMICKYSRLAAEHKLISGAGGNISARFKKADTFFISSTNKSLYSLTAEELVEVKIRDGLAVLETGLKPSKEANLHAGIYRNRENCQVIMHLHPTYAVAMSIICKEIPMLTVSSQLRLGSIPVVEMYKPGSRELLDAVVNAVNRYPDKENFLLTAHGIMSFGENFENVFSSVELIEESSHIAFLCRKNKEGVANEWQEEG